MNKIAMQARCIFCHKEQWSPLVYGISYGKKPCTWCGKKSHKMSDKEYRDTYNCGYENLTTTPDKRKNVKLSPQELRKHHKCISRENDYTFVQRTQHKEGNLWHIKDPKF